MGTSRVKGFSYYVILTALAVLQATSVWAESLSPLSRRSESESFCQWHSVKLAKDFVRNPLPRTTSYSMRKDKDRDWPAVEPIQVPTNTSQEILAAQRADVRGLSLAPSLGTKSVFSVNDPAEFTVRMEGQYFENPYADDFVIKAAFTHLQSGRKIIRRAFYFQDYEVVKCGEESVYVFRDENGVARPLNELQGGVYKNVNGFGQWRVRMTPLEAGAYSVDVTVSKAVNGRNYSFPRVYQMSVGPAPRAATRFTRAKNGYFVKVDPSENLLPPSLRQQDRTILLTGSMLLGERAELEKIYPGETAKE